jgi:hypothetical protein
MNIWSNIFSRKINTSESFNHIIKMTQLRVVDNSQIGKEAMFEGRPPKCIHVYNKLGVGYIGKICCFNNSNFFLSRKIKIKYNCNIL